MINEETLRSAAHEADEAITGSLPENYIHTFSPSFEKKMKSLLRREKHPAMFRLTKYIACAACVLALAGASLLAVNDNVRAAFFAWVLHESDDVAEYRFVGTKPDAETGTSSEAAMAPASESHGDSVSEAGALISAEYELTWIPDEFYFTDIIPVDEASVTIRYMDASRKRQMFFSYYVGADSSSLFIFDYSERKTVKVGDTDADFYQAKEENESSGLVWLSQSGEVCFSIMAPYPEEILIKMAESVVKK